MPHYIVFGRVMHDDDDSINIASCETFDEAIEAFVKWIKAERFDDYEEMSEDDITITWVIRCDQKPSILATPWG